MFEKIKAKILFEKLLGRPDIDKAYAMVDPSDSWYDTISTVHDSLRTIRELEHQTLQLKSRDGLILQGVYYPCKNSRITVICVHGYTSHAEREWAFPGLFYHSLGYNVLIPYQRAHGPSEGKYITFGGLEHLDVMDWIGLVNQMTPDGQIILHGLSMGGGIVLDLCDKECPGVRCLIADAPSISIAGFFGNIAHEVFKKDADPIAAHAIALYKKTFGVDARDFEAMEPIQNCKYPLLLAAGSNENREQDFAELQKRNPQPTEIVILPGCSHGNGMYKQTETFQGVIRSFVAKHLS
ncbi:MAG: alpha/beta hydrolase [Clostridia bacterium]|nr:alpha/beta hydrolase [Clostridia bacterium]